MAKSRSKSGNGRTVYVRIAPGIAGNLKKFQKAQASILDRLGCPCTSGYDIRWLQEENFLVNEAGIVKTVGF